MEPQTLTSCPWPRVLGAFVADISQSGRVKLTFSWCCGEALRRVRLRSQQAKSAAWIEGGVLLWVQTSLTFLGMVVTCHRACCPAGAGTAGPASTEDARVHCPQGWGNWPCFQVRLGQLTLTSVSPHGAAVPAAGDSCTRGQWHHCQPDLRLQKFTACRGPGSGCWGNCQSLPEPLTTAPWCS